MDTVQGRLDRWGDWQVAADGSCQASPAGAVRLLHAGSRKQEAGLLASSLHGEIQNETEFTTYFYNIATSRYLVTFSLSISS